MTDQEQHMIDDLVERIRTTPVTDKDVEAERHLQQTLGTLPDALYILAQTVLVQQYGLTQAQSQLEAQQNELEQLRREHNSQSAAPQKGSFLSRIFGADDSTAASPPPSGQGYPQPSQQAQPSGPGSGYQPVNYAPVPQGYPPPPYGGPGYGAGYPPAGYGQGGYGTPGVFGGAGGGGGFLRGALQTAAGVAAGAMVFQGMEDLFRGFGGHEGHGLGNLPGETVNNYYGEEGQRGSAEDRSLGNDETGFYNPERDASREDAGGQTHGFADTDSDSEPGAGSDDGSVSFDGSSGDADDSSDFSIDDGGGDDSNY